MNTTDRDGGRRPVIFVDVEASGLSPGSYPVEVGWACPRALPWGRCAIQLGSVLIRPDRGWLSLGSWDPDAEAVHGLARDALLRDGLPVADVCDLLDGAFGGRAVVTDTGGGSVDDEWLAILYEAAGREPAGWSVERQAADQVVIDSCREHRLHPEVVVPPLRSRAPRPTHAAAEDALVEAWLYAMVQQLARFRIGELGKAGQRAAMQDPVRAVAPDCWPRICAAGRGHRRRVA